MLQSMQRPQSPQLPQSQRLQSVNVAVTDRKAQKPVQGRGVEYLRARFE